MNTHLIIAYSLLAVAFLNGFLGFLLLKNNPHQSKVNYYVAMGAYSSALYSFFAAIVYIQEYYKQDFHAAYGACEIGMFALPAFLQATYYLKDPKSRKALWVGYILYPLFTVITILNVTTNLAEPSPISLIPFVPSHTPMEGPMRLVETLILLWGLAMFFIVRKNFTGMKRKQINYFILGALIYGVLATLSTGLIQLIGGVDFDPALTSYFCLPWVALTFYSITRYRLFDMQIIISTSLTILILTIILGTIDIVIFRAFVPYLGAGWSNLISLFIIIVIFLTTPLRRYIQGGINDTFLGDKYNYQEVLKESSRAIVTILDQEEMLNYLIHAIQQSFKIQKACLFLKKGEGPFLIQHHWGIDIKNVDGFQLSEEYIVDWLKKNKQIFIKEEQQGLMASEAFNRLYGNLDAIDAHLILPLFFKDNLIGFLTFGAKDDDRPYIQSDIDILEILASQTAIAIENARLYNEALTDGLTGLFHHKYFMMRLKEEMDRAKRYVRFLSLLMIDIDHFKNINDVCGHMAGDKVLVCAANLIKNASRTVDIVARYGGEEFAVILPDTNQEGALNLANRIRLSFEKSHFDGNLNVSVSIGLSTLDPQRKMIPMEDFIVSADKALYQAKHNGRNRVEKALDNQPGI